MSYAESFAIKLGSSRTALTLKARIMSSAFVAVGAEIAVGFVEVGGGEYVFDYAGFADGFRGFVYFFTGTYPGTFQTLAAVNSGVASSAPTADQINSALTVAHGGGSWQQVQPTGFELSVGGAIDPATDDFTARSAENFTRSWQVNGMDSTGWTQFVFTIKRNKNDDDDSESLIVVRESNPSDPSDGLIRMNGRATDINGLASLYINAAPPNTVATLSLTAQAMEIPPSGEIGAGAYHWGITRYSGENKVPLGGGEIEIIRAIRRDIIAP